MAIALKTGKIEESRRRRELNNNYGRGAVPVHENPALASARCAIYQNIA
jgi:hypothetical protein